MTSNQNIGHGHVFPRPDGTKARCGGPSMCRECKKDLVAKNAQERRSSKQLPYEITLELVSRVPTTAVIAAYSDGERFKQLLLRIDLRTQAIDYLVNAKPYSDLSAAIEAYNNE